MKVDMTSTKPERSASGGEPRRGFSTDKPGGSKQRLSLPRRIALAASIVLLLVGIGVIMYPLVQQWLFDWQVEETVEEFDAMSEELRDGKDEFELDLSALRAAMEAYNLDIYENGQEGFRDAWSYQVPSFDLTEWGLPDNMVAYLRIPAMGVTLPVYLGANTANMAIGAAHLSQTSLPIGGENVNTVIAAHRGMWSGLAMFRDIERLSIGDEIFLTNFWETLTYRVVETKVILPTDTDEVLIQEGRDMVTLITCHPYGNNTHRYAVYCERVE